jgi:prepilin-type processing-associated H-X9-DG protein
MWRELLLRRRPGLNGEFRGTEAAILTLRMRPSRNHTGFTYVELVIAMVIVIVLAGVVLGPSDAAAEKKKLAACAETMRKLHLTLMLYANEHDGVFPVSRGAESSGDALGLLVPAYSADDSIFGCEGGGYSYVMGLKRGERGMLVADRFGREGSNVRGEAAFHERGNHDRHGGNVLHADGHVEQLGMAVPLTVRVPAHAVLLNP